MRWSGRCRALGVAAALLAGGCATAPDGGSRELQGTAVHYADATVFQDCASGIRYPVPMEADHLALERAILAARSSAEAPVWVRVEGRIEEREPEPGAPPRPHLVVERFVEVQPARTCEGPRAARPPLFETRWQLLALDSDVLRENAKAPHLQLSESDGKAYGFSGCNRFFGTFERGADGALQFGPIAVTMMACPSPETDLEIAFLRAMAEVAAHRIRNGTLDLLDEDEVIVLQFEPTPQGLP